MTYAIFKAAGYQYRAELGDVLRLPSLQAEAGETVTFDQVLLGGADGETLIGRPTVEGAAVRAQVLSHGRADKIIVFKFKRRKNYRRKTGHRQNFTEVRISEIDLGGDRRVSLEPERKAKKPKAKAAKAAEAKAAPRKKPAAKPKARKPAAKPKAKAKTTAKAKTATKAKSGAKAKTTAKAKAAESTKSKKKKS